ncbi:MAG TPA: AraC family transcriptional regulator [Bacteroidales bacterium]
MLSELDPVDIDALFSNKIVEEGFSSITLIEKNQHLSLPFAELKAQNWWFEGIRIGYSDWIFQKDCEFDWQGNLDVVTLFFNLRGKTSTNLNVCGNNFELGNYQHNLFYFPHSHGKIRNHDLRLTNFMVQFTVESFVRLTAGASGVLKEFSDAVSLGKPGALSETNLYADGKMLGVIDTILNCSYREEVKKMFLLSKCLELLVLQTEACYNVRTVSSAFIKNDYDKERILYAREYLLQHMGNPPGLAELSRLAGINEFKLKKGFKEMFGNSVFGYLSDARLETAKNLMLDKQKSIGEIALELGYSSTQHLNNSFKKKFGITPGRLRG